MQKLFLTFALLAVCAVTNADQAVKIEFADASTLVIRLSDTPQIVNQDGEWLITSDVVEATYPRADVVSLEVGDYDDYVTGIGSASASTASLSYRNGTLSVTAAPNTRVTVINMSGMLVSQDKTNSDGEAVIDLQSLPGGAYIITCGGKSIKILHQ